MSFVIRAYSPGDETRINRMFNEVFHQNRSIDHWYWKYKDNPYGSYFISLAVSKDGIFAAHYAGYPVRLFFSPSQDAPAKEINTIHLGDKMTRRHFRSVGFGKGALIARTYAHFKDTFMNDTIPFAYGFAAQHSLRFGIRILKYADIEPVPYRKRDFGGLSSLAVNGIKRFASRLRIAEVSNVEKSWSDFFNAVAPFYTYLVKRDATYLNWRFLRRPDRKYLMLSVKKRGKLAGWAVFYREGNKIIWGDALFARGDLDAVKCILIHLRKQPYAEGADFIECWFPRRPEWWDETLEALGFRIEREPNDLHFTNPILTDDGTPEILRKYFYYTMGDSDLF